MRTTNAWLIWLTALIFFCTVLFSCGCGAEKQEGGSWQDWIERTRTGNYKVKVVEGGEKKMVALFRDGSFRLVPANRPHLVIYNAVTGDSWFYYISTNVIRGIGKDEAAASASLLPSKLLEPYIEMKRFWSEEGFFMDTKDGSSIRIKMEGPQHLPSAFEVYRQGRVFRRVEWFYSRMGEVSESNFEPPENAVAQ